jgi:hypothetical protein
MKDLIKLVAKLAKLRKKATPGPWVQWVEHASVYASTADLENKPYRLGGVRVKIAECEIDTDFDFMGTDEELENQGPYDGKANAAFITAVGSLDFEALSAALTKISAPAAASYIGEEAAAAAIPAHDLGGQQFQRYFYNYKTTVHFSPSLGKWVFYSEVRGEIAGGGAFSTATDTEVRANGFSLERYGNPSDVRQVADMAAKWVRSQPEPGRVSNTIGVEGPADGAALITAERQEQIHKHGWDVKHDEDYGRGELVQAAATCLSLYVQGDMASINVAGQYEEEKMWPWQSDFGMSFFKKIDRKSDIDKLKVAGALIAAEIDRLQAAAPHAS